MAIKPEPCNCERLSFPHRHGHACEDYAEILFNEEHDTLEDQRLDDPRHEYRGVI